MFGVVRYYLEDTPLGDETGEIHPPSVLNIDGATGTIPYNFAPNVYTNYVKMQNVLLDSPISGTTIKDPLFNVNYAGPELVSGYYYLDNIQVRILYRVLPIPEITVNPSVNYGGYTRTGPNNTPISVTFEAEDAENTGTDELTVEVRTAASGGGTLVATDDYTSGDPGSISIAHNASGLSEGSNTLYMRVGNGTYWSDDESFTLLVDRTAPTLDGDITYDPDPVTGGS